MLTPGLGLNYLRRWQQMRCAVVCEKMTASFSMFYLIWKMTVLIYQPQLFEKVAKNAMWSAKSWQRHFQCFFIPWRCKHSLYLVILGKDHIAVFTVLYMIKGHEIYSTNTSFKYENASLHVSPFEMMTTWYTMWNLSNGRQHHGELSYFVQILVWYHLSISEIIVLDSKKSHS